MTAPPEKPSGMIVHMLNACRASRYRDALDLQGSAFTELRTPFDSLDVDGRGLATLPPAELFGHDAHPDTAAALAGRLSR